MSATNENIKTNFMHQQKNLTNYLLGQGKPSTWHTGCKWLGYTKATIELELLASALNEMCFAKK